MHCASRADVGAAGTSRSFERSIAARAIQRYGRQRTDGCPLRGHPRLSLSPQSPGNLMKATNRRVATPLRAIAAVSLLACALVAQGQDLMSKNFIPQGEETLIVNLGGMLNQFGTSVQLNGAGGQGSNID